MGCAVVGARPGDVLVDSSLDSGQRRTRAVPCVWGALATRPHTATESGCETRRRVLVAAMVAAFPVLLTDASCVSGPDRVISTLLSQACTAALRSAARATPATLDAGRHPPRHLRRGHPSCGHPARQHIWQLEAKVLIPTREPAQERAAGGQDGPPKTHARPAHPDAQRPRRGRRAGRRRERARVRPEAHPVRGRY